jgi:flagellar protein FlgJ
MDGLSAMPTSAMSMFDPSALAGRRAGNDPKAQQEVGKQFESVFASMMVKEMRSSLEPDTLFGGDKGDVFGGLFDFFMGQHLAESGRLGLAQVLQKQLFRQGSAPAS